MKINGIASLYSGAILNASKHEMPSNLASAVDEATADEFETTFGNLSITTPEELAYILQNHVDWSGFNPNYKQREATDAKKEGNPYMSVTVMVTENPQITIGDEEWTGNRLQFNLMLHNIRPVGHAAETAASVVKPGKPVAALSLQQLRQKYSKK